MTPSSQASPAAQAPGGTPFYGLAPFLRMNLAAADIGPIAQQMLEQAQQAGDDPNLLMNLATSLFCLEKHETGLAVQGLALALTRRYFLPALRQPACLRVLMLMAPGDISVNTPLDCLLEDCDVDIEYYYVSLDGDPLPEPVPDHDLLVVGVGLFDASRAALEALEPRLADWPRPVVNPPRGVLNTARNTASELLQGLDGVVMPPTRNIARADLLPAATGDSGLGAVLPGWDYPVILRPLGSHAGHDLEKIDDSGALADYLARVRDAQLFISPFVDYSGPDGLFRKFRIALVDGQPFASHMAVSSRWMVHYVNAQMYEDAAKREEEAAFMANFADFAARHRTALEAIPRRIGLDYVCIDCAEVAGGLLVFEVDHAMVVHAMDPVDMFPYKPDTIFRARDAMRDYLVRRAAETLDASPR